MSMNWIKHWLTYRRTKKFIRNVMKNFGSHVIVKKWEHQTLGNAIYIHGNGFYGHLSNLRTNNNPSILIKWCDLRDGDVIVMDVSHSDNPITQGMKYEIGMFWDVEYPGNPPDMFFSKYVRLGFANDYCRDTIKRLADKY